MDNSYDLLDMTVYGRQETWEDSPTGWPGRIKGKQKYPYRWTTDGPMVSPEGRIAQQALKPTAAKHRDLAGLDFLMAWLRRRYQY